MYTSDQYEAEIERFKGASRQELVFIRKNLQFQWTLTERQQARIDAAKFLYDQVIAAENLERYHARKKNKRIESGKSVVGSQS
jgi:hypothetical protein